MLIILEFYFLKRQLRPSVSPDLPYKISKNPTMYLTKKQKIFVNDRCDHLNLNLLVIYERFSQMPRKREFNASCKSSQKRYFFVLIMRPCQVR